MELEVAVLERVRAYESLSRWERSQLGRELRILGLSYGEIMDLIPVKKSTLATWCRDVRLTEGQIQAIKKRRAPEPGIPRNTNRKRKAEIAELRAIACDLAHESSTILNGWLASSCTGLRVPRLAITSAWPTRIHALFASSFFGYVDSWTLKRDSHLRCTFMRGMTRQTQERIGANKLACIEPTFTRHSSSQRERAIARTT